MAGLAAKQALMPVRAVRPIISVRAVLEQLSAFAVLATPVTPRLGCAGLADQFFTREGVAVDRDEVHDGGSLEVFSKSASDRTSYSLVLPSSTCISYSSAIPTCSLNSWAAAIAVASSGASTSTFAD